MNVERLSLIMMLFSTSSCLEKNIIPKELKLIKSYQFDNISYQYFESDKDSEKLKVTKKSNFSIKQFESYKRIENARISHIYHDSRVPYLGAITKEISSDCQKEDLPEVVFNETEFTVVYKTNIKLHYGVCRKKLLSHKAVRKFKYCPSNAQLTTFEYSNILADFKIRQFLREFTCKN
jgi:hypothetical protein